MAKIQYTVEVESLTCAGCGTPFAVEVDLLNKFRHTHETFFCPLGHNNYFPSESKEEKLQRQLKEYQKYADTLKAEVTFERDQRKAAESSLRATKAALTKTKKRIAAGVCPCCNRTFQNVARHMAGQHPEYKEG